MSRKSLCLEMIFEDRPFTERFMRAAELGIEAVEFWEWQPKDLDAVTVALRDNDLELIGMAGLGVDGPNLTDPEVTDRATDRIEESIDVAREIDCPNLIVLVGDEQSGESRSAQRDRIVSGLQQVSSSAESADVTLLIEPLNTAIDHPNYYLETADEGFEIVETVGSTHVQLLYDVYHQQITEGNIITTITEHIEEIGHFHFADVPGRHEPGTGELAYPNIIAGIREAGYEGYIGFEFQPSGTPEAAVESMLRL